jgi:hypothetical protein
MDLSQAIEDFARKPRAHPLTGGVIWQTDHSILDLLRRLNQALGCLIGSTPPAPLLEALPWPAAGMNQ